MRSTDVSLLRSSWDHVVGLVAAGLLCAGGCAGSETAKPVPPAGPTTSVYHEGQMVETGTGKIIPLDQMIHRLADQEVIYLGEEHHNRFHIESARAILIGLISEGRRPVLAMEMFGWDGQSALDLYLSPQSLARDDFLDRVRWRQNWGGSFEDYEPLVQIAQDRRLPVIALNPPKGLVRSVAKQGLAQARYGPEMVQWGMGDETIVDDPDYRERILRQLRACHDGGPDDLYQTMYEASMVRDEGMAKTIVTQVRRLRSGKEFQTGPVVSYTGGGHVQYNLPVPKRVARRLDSEVRQVSIYMSSFEPSRLEELQGMVKEKIADYLWLTKVSAQGPPRRCR